MTNQSNNWIKENFIVLRKTFPYTCNHNNTAFKRQFAHLRKTGLKGKGRGRKERFYDIVNNLDKYILSCDYCHYIIDRMKKQGFPTWFIRLYINEL